MINLKPHISRIDKSFKEDLTRNYQLTIQLSLDGFSFVVYSTDKQRFIFLEHYLFHQVQEVTRLAAMIDEVILKRQWLAYAFQNVTVLVENESNVLVPMPLFDEKEKGSYLAFAQEFVENSRIVYDRLKNNESYNVYYLPHIFVSKIKDHWANATIVHSSSVLIESLLIENKNKGSEATVFVNVHKNRLEFVVIKNEKLLFYNTFKFQTKEDFVYFLLFSMEQLHLNPEVVPLYFMGSIEENSEIFTLTERYMRYLSFVERNKKLNYSYLLEEIPFHKHYLLYHTQRCEL
ncbi:MAG: DUF3822 family protein [Lentimicrobiaceae bacterium]|jgi:hypothetical protein|nr:DUF3822 family protein [Lentimicrobiaceae bacterium]